MSTDQGDSRTYQPRGVPHGTITERVVQLLTENAAPMSARELASEVPCSEGGVYTVLTALKHTRRIRVAEIVRTGKVGLGHRVYELIPRKGAADTGRTPRPSPKPAGTSTHNSTLVRNIETAHLTKTVRSNTAGSRFDRIMDELNGLTAERHDLEDQIAVITKKQRRLVASLAIEQASVPPTTPTADKPEESEPDSSSGDVLELNRAAMMG